MRKLTLLVVNCFQFFIFAGVIHSLACANPSNFLVVNCFQFFIFAVLFTVSFEMIKDSSSCELLSVLYICGVIHSILNDFIDAVEVVNCFQFFIFAVLFTVAKRKRDTHLRCELLSVLYICGVIHSQEWSALKERVVVNCFQFFIFAVLFTVCGKDQRERWRLWIAFSSLYLRCYSQSRFCLPDFVSCCELLSVLYICGVIHSPDFACLILLALWIAFSSLYLRCYSQSLVQARP